MIYLAIMCRLLSEFWSIDDSEIAYSKDGSQCPKYPLLWTIWDPIEAYEHACSRLGLFIVACIIIAFACSVAPVSFMVTVSCGEHLGLHRRPFGFTIVLFFAFHMANYVLWDYGWLAYNFLVFIG